jgi:hypothetical protein
MTGPQGYYLVSRDPSAQFTGWKVAGNFMGEHHPDTVRKIYNEGGLYGEVYAVFAFRLGKKLTCRG